jgi:hypothetical protein
VAHTPEKSRPLASKPKRIYAPRLISDHIMVQEDFERLHKFLLETEGLSEISDDMRELVKEEWPELVRLLCHLHLQRVRPHVHRREPTHRVNALVEPRDQVGPLMVLVTLCNGEELAGQILESP